jgi:4-aminobutyrate aminotransferase-like enzyme
VPRIRRRAIRCARPPLSITAREIDDAITILDRLLTRL